MPKKFVAVIGGRACSPEEWEAAEKVGRELARQGAAVICGGTGGVMEAACKGAASEGGITIGILPGETRQMANPYVNIPIITGMGYSRNVIVVKSAQAVIAIGGSFGTLSEIAHAVQSNIPVIGLNTWSLARNGQTDSTIVTANSPSEAVELALRLAVEN